MERLNISNVEKLREAQDLLEQSQRLSSFIKLAKKGGELYEKDVDKIHTHRSLMLDSWTGDDTCVVNEIRILNSPDLINRIMKKTIPFLEEELESVNKKLGIKTLWTSTQ